MSAQPEQWRVSTYEGIFETDLDTLRQWILEGAVLPTDKVSKGTLNWIDAGRVPKLKGAFNGEAAPPPTPVSNESTVNEAGWQTPPTYEQVREDTPPVSQPLKGTLANSCHNHPDLPPKYVCRMCATTFCSECPRFVGSSKIALCPECGDLCRNYQEVTTKTARAEFQGSGFGMSDFVRALSYPLQHKAALIGGALLYGFLLIAGFRGSMVAWVLMFGCICHVISQVAWGRLNRSFMPDFGDFNVMEDVLQPILLGVGITIVSWGPVVVLVIALIFGVISSGSQPGVLNHSPASAQGETLTPEDMEVLSDPNADPKKLEEANRRLNGLRPGSQIAREAERSKEEQVEFAAGLKQILPYLSAGIFFVLLFLVFVAWGVFYYPMALTVAGYTQSFWSVVNPMVGIDTIRRMGATYFKAFGMVLLVQFVSAIISGIVAIVLSPFAMPFVGNLPANFIGGGITFYFNLVIACVLGLSLFKCADRLGINVD